MTAEASTTSAATSSWATEKCLRPKSAVAPDCSMIEMYFAMCSFACCSALLPFVGVVSCACTAPVANKAADKAIAYVFMVSTPEVWCADVGLSTLKQR